MRTAVVFIYIYVCIASCSHFLSDRSSLTDKSQLKFKKVALSRTKPSSTAIPSSTHAYPLTRVGDKVYANTGHSISELNFDVGGKVPFAEYKEIVTVKDQISGSIVVKKKFIVFVENNGLIHKLNLDNKGLVHRPGTSSHKDSWSANLFEPVSTSPYIYRNFVFIRTVNNIFYCLDFLSGKKIWSYKMKPPANNINIDVQTSPLIMDNKVIISDTLGILYCLDIDNGSLIWQYDHLERGKLPIKEVISLSGPYDDLIFAIYFDGSISALKILNDGSEPILKWKFVLEQEAFISSYIIDSSLYVASLSGKIYKLSVNDGTVIWKEKLRDRANYITSYNSAVYVMGGKGRLSILNDADGKQVFTTNFEAPLLPPIFFGKYVLLPTANGNLYTALF